MSYSNRIWVYGPVGLLVLILLLYSIFWRVQSQMLAARLDGANGGEIIPGVVFTFADKTISGFPFRLDAVLSDVMLAHEGPDGATSWRTEKLALHVLASGDPLYILETAGQQVFEQPGDARGRPRLVYTMTPSIARASAILRNRRLARFDLDLWEPEVKDASEGAPPARTVTAARAQLHLLARPDETIDVAVRIDQGKIGEGFKPAIGTTLSLLDLRGKLENGGSLLPLAGGSEGVFDAAEQWRKAGGLLNVQALSLNWENLKTELAGTIGLDTSHRLAGSLRGTLDAAQALAALTRGGIKLPPMGESHFSLTFDKGDIKVGVESGLLGAPN